MGELKSMTMVNSLAGTMPSGLQRSFRWLPREPRCLSLLVFFTLVFWAVLIKLCILLIDIQTKHASYDGVIRLIGRLLLSVQMDISIAFVLSLLTLVMGYLVSWSAVMSTVASVCVLLGTGLWVAFAVGNIELWIALRGFLTYNQYSQAGGIGKLETTIRSLIPYKQIVSAAILAMLTPIAINRLCSNWLRKFAKPVAWVTFVVAVTAVLGVSYKIHPSPKYEQGWSPQLLFASTWYRRTYGLGPNISVPDEYFGDFNSVGSNWVEFSTPIMPRVPPKNIILVVLESVGKEHFPTVNSDRKVAPHLAKLGDEGITFNNFYANSTLSADSLVAITRSVLPKNNNDGTLSVDDASRSNIRHLPAVLSSQGYRTGIVGPIIASREEANYVKSLKLDWIGSTENLGLKDDWMSWRDVSLAQPILRWIDEDKERPFFIMIWTSQTHFPYPGRHREAVSIDQTSNLKRFLKSLNETDEMVGVLRDGLKSRGLDKNTALAVTGDHGESFGHKGLWARGELYEPSIKVPFVIFIPGIESRRMDGLGSHIDVAPTLLDMTGITTIPSEWQGRSLLKGHRHRVYFLSHLHFDYLAGVREGNLKYINWGNFDREELYNLELDPLENSNLSMQPDRTIEIEKFRRRLVAWHRFQPRAVTTASKHVNAISKVYPPLSAHLGR